ncbi:potassium transporter TrkG [Maricaulis maris]|uniref:Trk-type K+ transport system membrane component n=1 Tax=Maricaulis maris TaxID=74318 RepID=A0A495DJK5_9PROT|nr:potassium transporter TrkG [Maricaulis maris]RKR02803.1 Trk-type K+ transport system membrane component [Maricaulis maris]
MTPVAFLRPLGALWVLLAGVALFAAFVAAAVGEPHLAPLFGTTALIAFIPGIFILTATRGLQSKASALDALGLALLSWITAPAMAALPFWLTGYFDPIDAVFEAYSAVTTTGATLLPAEDLPRSLIFWRAILAWLGGYASLLLAIGIFAALDRDIPAIRKSALLTLRSDNVFSHLPQAARRIGVIYTILTSLIWLGLLFGGNGLFTSTVLAMSAISTSGYTVADGGLLATIGPISTLWVVIGCLLGSLNIALFWDVLRDRSVLRDPDILGISALIIGLGFFFILARPGTPFSDFMDAAFIVSTSGFSAGGGVIPALAASIFVALIGGAAASTTGGIKVSRILLLWKRMGAELAVLSDPRSVVPVSFRGRRVHETALVGIWAYVLAFVGSIGLGTMALTAAGLNFEDAFLAMTAALANIGPLFDQSEPLASWSHLPDQTKPILISAMILGRLEVLAAIAAVWALFIRK